MKLINWFIDWKKNIKYVDYYGISMIFDKNHVSFEQVKQDIYNLFHLIPDEKLKKKLLLNDIAYEQSQYGEIYSAEFDYDMKCMPIVQPRFGLSDNIIEKKLINRIACSFILSDISQDFLVELSRVEGLVLMILYNPNDRLWENKDWPSAYKYKGGLKTYFCNNHKVEKVDISDRPGRITRLGNIAWYGGAEYWFGQHYYKKMAKKKVLEFEHADLVEELPNNLVHIKLLSLKDYWTNESQGRLWDLREHLEIDKLEKEYLSSIV